MTNGKLHLTLATLPLFQGVAANDLAHVLEKVSFERKVLPRGATWVEPGEVCQHLVFLTEGCMQSTTQREGYSFSEFLEAPNVIEPDILYGIQRQYTSHYSAATDCQLLMIPKNDVGRLLFDIEVFRLNYLNLLSTLAWRRQKACIPSPCPTLREAVIHFLISHAKYPKGKMTFDIRMSDIGHYVGASRVLVSQTLHKLHADGLVTIGRNYIEIPWVERFKDLKI